MGSKQKNRSGKRIFLIVLIILVTTLGGALLFYSNGIGATSMTSKNVTVTIKQGSIPMRCSNSLMKQVL